MGFEHSKPHSMMASSQTQTQQQPSSARYASVRLFPQFSGFILSTFCNKFCGLFHENLVFGPFSSFLAFCLRNGRCAALFRHFNDWKLTTGNLDFPMTWVGTENCSGMHGLDCERIEHFLQVHATL